MGETDARTGVLKEKGLTHLNDTAVYHLDPEYIREGGAERCRAFF